LIEQSVDYFSIASDFYSKFYDKAIRTDADTV